MWSSGQTRRLKHGWRPLPFANLQPKGSRGVRHIGCIVSGHAQPHEVFWQDYVRSLFIDGVAREISPN